MSIFPNLSECGNRGLSTGLNIIELSFFFSFFFFKSLALIIKGYIATIHDSEWMVCSVQLSLFSWVFSFWLDNLLMTQSHPPTWIPDLKSLCPELPILIYFSRGRQARLKCSKHNHSGIVKGVGSFQNEDAPNNTLQFGSWCSRTGEQEREDGLEFGRNKLVALLIFLSVDQHQMLSHLSAITAGKNRHTSELQLAAEVRNRKKSKRW